jgi:hypothetical protein
MFTKLREGLKLTKMSLNKPTVILGAAVGILLLLNILLLYRTSELRTENMTWKNKVVLSLADQRALVEHSLEGEYLGDEIDLLQKRGKLQKRGEGLPRLKMLYSFGMACENCLNMELGIYQTQASRPKDLNVTPIMVFGNIEQPLFARLVASFGIEDISIRDEGNILINKFSKLTTPVIFLINSNSRVLAANISDYGVPDKSIKFYEKVFNAASQF